jgi:drug/metabolite transporter (DMT)-like permease
MAQLKMTVRPDRVTLAAFAIMVVLAGANFVGVRFSNRELPPFWGATLRFTIASTLLFAVVALRRMSLPRGRALVGALLYGLFGFGISYTFAYWALVKVPGGLASIVMACGPLITMVLAAAQGLESMRLRGLVGSLVAVGGIVVMFGRSAGIFGSSEIQVPLASLLAVIGAGLAFSEASVVAKRFPKLHPVTMNAIAMATGAAILLTISLVAGEKWAVPTQGSTLVAIGYLVFLGSVTAFILYLFVLGRWTASGVSYQFVLFPLVAVTLSALLDGEPLTPALAAGGLLVLGGVYLGALSQARAVEPPPGQPCS